MSRRFADFADLREMAVSARASHEWVFAYADHQTIAKVQQFLAERVRQHVPLAAVAGAFYISEVYLSELFKKHTQLTIVSFIRQIRLTRAKALLRGTDLSIKEIARQVGFDDASYFGRQFKREMGLSPESFRQGK